MTRGVKPLNIAAGIVSGVILVLGLAGVVVPVVTHVSHWLTAVVLMGVLAAIVLEGSYQINKTKDERLVVFEANEKAATERLARLRTADPLVGETFFPHELFEPEDGQKRALVSHRTFVRCRIQGPGVIALLGNVGVTDCKISIGPEANKAPFYEVTETRGLLGPMAFLHCKFDHCHFDGIGFVSHPAVIAQLRSSYVVG